MLLFLLISWEMLNLKKGILRKRQKHPNLSDPIPGIWLSTSENWESILSLECGERSMEAMLPYFFIKYLRTLAVSFSSANRKWLMTLSMRLKSFALPDETFPEPSLLPKVKFEKANKPWDMACRTNVNVVL